MPREPHSSKYPWPASAITPEDMALIHAVRESSRPRIPITRLLAHAVRETFGRYAETTPAGKLPEERKDAA
jgi:hypothetical protein